MLPPLLFSIASEKKGFCWRCCVLEVLIGWMDVVSAFVTRIAATFENESCVAVNYREFVVDVMYLID